MIRLAAVVRGMLQRGGTTVMILAVALVATAAAAAGPLYYQAARTSILRDTVAGVGVSNRGYEADENGAVPGLVGQLAPAVRSQLDQSLGSLAGRGLFAHRGRTARRRAAGGRGPGGGPCASLADLGLEAHADQLVEELSGGRAVRPRPRPARA